MKMTRIFTAISAILLCPLAMFATKQVGEKLNYNGKDMAMPSAPLSSYLATLEAQSVFQAATGTDTGYISTSCRRGYIGEWKIESGRLFCVAISVGENVVDAGRIFPGKTSPVFASWCSEVLEVNDGQLLEGFQPPKFVEIYSKKTYFFVSHGTVLREVSIEIGDIQSGVADFDAAVSFVEKQENPDKELIKDAANVRKDLMKSQRKNVFG